MASSFSGTDLLNLSPLPSTTPSPLTNSATNSSRPKAGRSTPHPLQQLQTGEELANRLGRLRVHDRHDDSENTIPSVATMTESARGGSPELKVHEAGLVSSAARTMRATALERSEQELQKSLRESARKRQRTQQTLRGSASPRLRAPKSKTLSVDQKASVVSDDRSQMPSSLGLGSHRADRGGSYPMTTHNGRPEQNGATHGGVRSSPAVLGWAQNWQWRISYERDFDPVAKNLLTQDQYFELRDCTY
ncbi:hypothetical protein DL93DRAFT_305218 [Clavulina sp. PMI_390]|nr:hypothetical protein DL93DRAFT_305218 [Clavulina sp. PMI_390]